jgi:probable F420-dependent oxidoreductase
VKVRFAVAPAPGTFDVGKLASFAVTAEELGFDTIWLSDVPLGSIGDPLLSLAHVAALTTTLKLGANVVPLGRNPMILARQLAQLDRLSGGRLLLSLVPGIDQPGERAALGLPTGDRWAEIEHDIGLLRRWWAGETVDGGNGHFAFKGIAVGPTPLQEPLEIWLGGAGPKALARVGRSADGWLTANVTPPEAAAGRRLVERHAQEAGREIDPEHFGISMPYARDVVPDEAVAALRARRSDGDLAGIVPVGASDLVELIDGHIAAGLSKFVLRPLDPHGGVSDQLGWLADNVLPLQT